MSPVPLEQAIMLDLRKEDVERMRVERVNNPDDWVQLWVNPRRISIQSRKVIHQVQTSTRWVFQHWGMEPVTIRYSGFTGAMKTLMPSADSPPGLHIGRIYDVFDASRGRLGGEASPYNTPAYRALRKLREFYEEPHKSLQGVDLTQLSGEDINYQLRQLLLSLYYRNGKYVGYFTRMEIQEEETSPWMWNYEMEFVACRSQLDMSEGSISQAELMAAFFASYPYATLDGPFAEAIRQIQTAGRAAIETLSPTTWSGK